MANKRYIMMDLDDEKIAKLSHVISNKTAKKIIDLLAEENLSESDIAKRLNIPVNTVEYNLKKLYIVGLVEKAKQFFWSPKGKKIPIYKLSRKEIIISTKKRMPSVIPSLIAVALAAVGIRIYTLFKASQIPTTDLQLKTEEIGAASIEAVGPGIQVIQNASLASPEIALWFLLGGLVAILIFLLWNYHKFK